jgi:16S rRNA (adenine1518-N6/adenine1519-N6)-dimethyltransferase
VLETDFLQHDLSDVYGDCEFAIIGNYPYNISTQIVFKMLDYRNQVLEFGGMFQKEVAQRICAPHGSKTYGILSVLAQAYYDAEYLFTVPPGAFNPPPKVHSGVLILKRKDNFNQLGCSYKKLKQVVKLAFGQRRKTLRNSLKSLQLDDDIRESEIMSRRPEQISVEEFIGLTKQIFPNQEV